VAVALAATIFLGLGRWRWWMALGMALAIQAADQRVIWQRYLQFQSLSQAVAGSEVLAPLANAGDPFRVLDAGGALRHPNQTLLAGLENAMGYHGLMMAGPKKLLAAMQGRQEDWLDLMNVRYLLYAQANGPSAWPHQALGKIQVYENPRFLPRAFMVPQAVNVGTADEAFQALGQPSFDIRRKLAWEGGPTFSGGPVASRVQWLLRRPERLSLRVDSTAHGALVLSNNWYPSWKASVDGRPVPLWRANGSLQALELEAGSHRVELRFDPTAFKLGLALALGGLLALGLLWRRLA
jgi:hypothetical protein